MSLHEHASKLELAKAGLIVPKSVVISRKDEIEQATQTLESPFALKALGIAHKSEVGAVALNLQTTQDVANALQTMAHLSDQFLFEEMAQKPLAELIVGVTRDPVCGYC